MKSTITITITITISRGMVNIVNGMIFCSLVLDIMRLGLFDLFPRYRQVSSINQTRMIFHAYIYDPSTILATMEIWVRVIVVGG